jgi:hypothetical protein
MLTLRPIDPVAIAKRLESPDALVISASASTIDTADVGRTFGSIRHGFKRTSG